MYRDKEDPEGNRIFERLACKAGAVVTDKHIGNLPCFCTLMSNLDRKSQSSPDALARARCWSSASNIQSPEPGEDLLFFGGQNVCIRLQIIFAHRHVSIFEIVIAVVN